MNNPASGTATTTAGSLAQAERITKAGGASSAANLIDLMSAAHLKPAAAPSPAPFKRQIIRKTFSPPPSVAYATGHASGKYTPSEWQGQQKSGPRITKVITHNPAEPITPAQNYAPQEKPTRPYSVTSSTVSSDNYKLRVIQSSFGHAVTSSDYLAFEDGVHNLISKAVVRLVSAYGNSAVSVIAAHIFKPQTHPLIASEITTWLARLRHVESEGLRATIIRDALFHPHPFVRDAAISGLYRMPDEMTTRAVRSALAAETDVGLLGNLHELARALTA